MHFTFTTYIGLSNKRIFSSLGKTLHIERVPSNRKKNRARELYVTQPPCTIINLTTYLFKEIRSTLLRTPEEAVASIEMRGYRNTKNTSNNVNNRCPTTPNRAQTEVQTRYSRCTYLLLQAPTYTCVL